MRLARDRLDDRSGRGELLLRTIPAAFGRTVDVGLGAGALEFLWKVSPDHALCALCGRRQNKAPGAEKDRST